MDPGAVAVHDGLRLIKGGFAVTAAVTTGLTDEPILTRMRSQGFKKVVLCNDDASGLSAIIAIHSTDLGPAIGGVRMWPSPTSRRRCGMCCIWRAE